ncbi:hypothetical protein EJ110_NYTH50074 [Nymphaea thermarum]|nr:hypothetical protein EJ110_NYTH50074 [Nymphaea thermarum]
MAMEAPASPSATDQGELNTGKRLKSHGTEDVMKSKHEEEEEELLRSAVNSNFIVDFLKTSQGHDHYVYLHANYPLAEEAGIAAVNFSISVMKAIGKRKKVTGSLVP